MDPWFSLPEQTKRHSSVPTSNVRIGQRLADLQPSVIVWGKKKDCFAINEATNGANSEEF
jgi:hypothetical protein